MKRSKNGTAVYPFFILASLLVSPMSFACTIASAVAADGQVWNCNNEDGVTGVANFINVFPKSGEAKYGYYTFSHFSPKQGEGGNIQGGMNETGLTFDFNAINREQHYDPKSKKALPPGDDRILPHILATMRSVEEVVQFFEVYWFQNGFHSAQMHVADRQGRFAIISASGTLLAEKGQPLVSTNFDLCGKEDGSSCHRYPIAVASLKKHGAGLSTMMDICRATAQGESTLYSNVQNLTTGDAWFFSNHDPRTPIKTSVKDLLAKGRKSYTFSDLKSLIEDRPVHQPAKPVQIDLASNVKSKYAGTYANDFTGKLVVEVHEEGIKISTEQGSSFVLQPQSHNVFFFPNEEVRVEFEVNKKPINGRCGITKMASGVSPPGGHPEMAMPLAVPKAKGVIPILATQKAHLSRVSFLYSCSHSPTSRWPVRRRCAWF